MHFNIAKQKQSPKNSFSSQLVYQKIAMFTRVFWLRSFNFTRLYSKLLLKDNCRPSEIYRQTFFINFFFSFSLFLILSAILVKLFLKIQSILPTCRHFHRNILQFYGNISFSDLIYVNNNSPDKDTTNCCPCCHLIKNWAKILVSLKCEAFISSYLSSTVFPLLGQFGW